jgi:hypothetical protein
MFRRLRPTFLILALILTGVALDSRATAMECVEDTHEWADLGSCCSQFNPPVVKLYLRMCENGQWVVYPNTYKCPREACS